jgi:hypothetical protein
MWKQSVSKGLPDRQGWREALNRARYAWQSGAARLSGKLATMATCVPLVLALAITGPTQAHAETPKSIAMKMLLVSADGKEPTFAAMKSVLDQVGVPYDVLIASTMPFSARSLSDGAGAGRYQGILLATGNLGYETPSGDFVSAWSTPQWQALWDYERNFKVRQATLYTYPGGDPDTYGLNYHSGVDTTTAPQQANVTAAGKAVFSYLNTSNPITISNAWTYLATPASSTNPVPLLQSSQGFAIASIYNYPDGRSNLAITADGNPNSIHSLALGYGILNWVSKGMFLGARKVYMNPQPDDILIEDEMWDPARNANNGTFRVNGSDLSRLVEWQDSVRKKFPTAAGLTVEMPFNGVGASGIYANDTLTPAVRLNQKAFRWVSHTYTHPNLNEISYSDALDELRSNDSMAKTLGFTHYSPNTMIQPEISGLNNPEFLRAAADFGIRSILSDTSQPGWDNPTPNTGFYSQHQPGILIIPRRPTNLYYNVSTPAEWVSEYNHFYAPGGLFPYWDRALSYAEILDKESDIMLRYLLKYDVDSLMFHQPNLRAYDQRNSLMGDLLEATLVKYERLFALPVVSPGQVATGELMAARMAYNKSGVKATLLLGAKNKIVVQTQGATTVPVTGVAFQNNCEKYGGQDISYLKLAANQSIEIDAPAW